MCDLAVELCARLGFGQVGDFVAEEMEVVGQPFEVGDLLGPSGFLNHFNFTP